MNFFNQINFKINQKKELIQSRKNRKIIPNTGVGKFFYRGDILTINFWAKSYNFHFEGLCLSIKKKNLLNPDTIILLRNILQNTGIEITVPYFLNRLYLNTFISDYKRKKLWYRKSKLYFLRDKENKASKVNL